VASADDIARTIEPGSLPQGDRQAFAANLQQALAGSQQAGPSVPPPGPGGADPLGDELGFLDSETISDKPVTAGLSVGPGGGPAPTTVDSPKIEKLRAIALGARSPVLRQMARDALRAEIARRV
jgi:hypothetical protein